MTQFKNVTDHDLDVYVDGRSIHAGAGQPFEVPDEFADQLRSQDIYEEIKTKKSTAAADEQGAN